MSECQILPHMLVWRARSDRECQYLILEPVFSWNINIQNINYFTFLHSLTNRTGQIIIIRLWIFRIFGHFNWQLVILSRYWLADSLYPNVISETDKAIILQFTQFRTGLAGRCSELSRGEIFIKFTSGTNASLTRGAETVMDRQQCWHRAGPAPDLD